MLFNSFQFLLFFPIVTIIFFLLPHKLRWLHLLVASCVFYMAFVPIYILILFITIIIDYIAGILIENAEGSRRKWFLVMSIVANVGVLAYFKYYHFFVNNIEHVFRWAHYNAQIPLLNIILPIGLSFHTFQAMSYTIEVYRGNQKAERHMGIYALYVMFYPQLVAGPIERPQNMLHQFHEKHVFDYDNAVGGLRQMLWGLVKKVVIADRLAIAADQVFNDPHQFSGIALAIGAFIFCFQLYCDFSAYSDIALGSARVMGFVLMVNFNHPFLSRSVTEFWRRWHISLSTWFYDYLFNPIVVGLRDWGKSAVIIGLLITFGLSGLWHGAGWKFIIYGLLNGIALSYEYFTKKQRKKVFNKLPQTLNNGISKVLTFSFMSFCWIFFRAKNVRDSFFIVKKTFCIPKEILKVISTKKIAFLHIPGLINIILPCLGLIVFLEVARIVQARYLQPGLINKKPKYVRWVLYYSGILALLFLGVYEHREFIYFQF